MVVASWRSSVIRNGQSRDVELVPDTEVPTRIAKNFQQLQKGFRAIGLNENPASELLVRVGLDSIPLVRGKILRMLIEGPHSTSDISERLVGYSPTTIRRHLEEVKAHAGVYEKILEKGQQPRWILPEKIGERLTRLGIGPVSQLANDGERPTNSTREDLADHRQPEKSETVRNSQPDGGTARVRSTESQIPEKSESVERESSKQLTHQSKPVGTES
jgi:DNA-binding transcriptional ArsR family regulator